MTRNVLIAALAALALACSDDAAAPPGGPGSGPAGWTLVDATPGVTYAFAVDVRTLPDGRRFVVEQGGRIVVVDTTGASSVFLDVTARVVSGGERGLLGLAFPPDYAATGFFFVYYTAAGPGGLGVSRVSRFRVSSDPDSADAASEVVLIEMSQRRANHNGGGLDFDDAGNLYVGVGDEGGAGDDFDNAQDLTTPHGSILRIDPSQNTTSPPYYGIPADNPFAVNLNGWRPEIWAWGLRNPWRIAWDSVTGTLWVGDVGQDAWEEIDRIASPGNFGWDCREGGHAFVPLPGQDPPSDSCGVRTAADFVDPVAEYSHADGDESITGGFVVRGGALPGLEGRYVFADFVSGRLFALDPVTGAIARVMETRRNVSSLGRDVDGGVLVVEYGLAARLWRLEPATP